MSESTPVLTPSDLIDMIAIGPSFELAGVRWRLISENAVVGNYLGVDRENRLWCCGVYDHDIVNWQLESLAYSYKDAVENELRRRGCRASTMMAQCYIPPGHTLVMGKEPNRTFVTRNEDGSFTHMEEYGTLADGTIGAIRYT